MARILDWAVRIIAALVLLQTLYFKFLGSEESVFIFTAVGVEPWGRYATGMAELVASVLLLVPRTVWAGAGLGIVLMTGAILSHFFVLGIEVQDDGGLLFGMAVVVFLSCVVALVMHRAQVPFLGSKAA